jgi:uncharacterized protein YndB with AHSA1/START domain
MVGHVATAAIDIDASADQVWAALTDPGLIKRYMFGSEVETDWRENSPIFWRGEYEGRPYEDKGEILAVEPPQRLQMSHFSPLSGQPDSPENYHTLLYELSEQGGKTHVVLTQDNNASPEEAERATATWTMLLTSLREVVEQG